MGRELVYGQAENEALRQEMRRDPTVIVIGEDIVGAAGRQEKGLVDAYGGPAKATRGLIQEFGPLRMLDTPISEAGFVGAAIGAAVTGLRPVVELMFTDLMPVACDQIMNQAAKFRYMCGGKAAVPLVIRTSIGAAGTPGVQHSQVLYSLVTHVPGLKVICPTTPYNVKGLMASAIRDDDPVLVFHHKLQANIRGEVPEEPYTIPLGKAEVRKPGKDITLVGISYMVDICLEAAKALEDEGIEAEVIDLLSLVPLDEETILSSVARTHRLVVVDESHPRCSVARDIAAIVADKGFDYLDAPIKTVTGADTPIPALRNLVDEFLPSAPKVVRVVKEMLG